MNMRKEVNRGKFIFSFSHLSGRYLSNACYVPGAHSGAIVNKMDMVPALVELKANQ